MAPATTTTTAAAASPGTSAAPSTAAPAAAVSSVVLNLVDRSRPTVSHGRQVSSARALTTTVWYPAGALANHPLIVFAHGYSVGVAPYVRVCQAWARAGFVVAAPEFPLTDKAVAGANLDEGDLPNQPGDVSFVTTALLGADQTPGSPLAGRIDPHRIVVAGHSDGADTALAVAYLPGKADSRIGAAIVDAPDPLPLPAGAAKLVSRVPLLLIHGDHDSIAPFSGSQRVLTQLSAPGWFLILRGADHLAPIQGPSPWTATLDRVTTDFAANAFGPLATLNAALTADVTGAPVTLQNVG